MLSAQKAVASPNSITGGPARINPPATKKATRLRRVFTITAGEAWYGIPIEAVRTVFRVDTISEVPLSPPSIAGLVNVRGEILTVIHLTHYLGLEPINGSGGYLMVGIEHNDEAYGLIVDKAGDILEIDEAARVTIPAGADGQTTAAPLPTYKLESGLLPILDVESMLACLATAPAAGAGIHDPAPS